MTRERSARMSNGLDLLHSSNTNNQLCNGIAISISKPSTSQLFYDSFTDCGVRPNVFYHSSRCFS